MTATLTTVNAILKEVYGPRIVDQLQSEAVGYKRIEKTSDGVTETVGGKYVDFPIRIKRNHGIGYRSENGTLPAAKRQSFAEVHIPLAYGYGRVQFTGQLMKLAKSNVQAFTNAMEDENDSMKETLTKDTNRIFYGDSTGLICSIDDTAVSATHDVDNAQYLEEGMQVDVLIRSSGATVVLDTEVVTVSGTSVTFGDSFTGALTQGVYRQGSYDKEPEGLGSIVLDSGTLYGVDPTSVSKWKAVRAHNSGTNRPLSESLMITQVDAARVNGGKTSLILTSLGVRRSYFNLLTQQRRFTNTKEFAGGFTGLAFNHGREIPVIEDVDHKPNKMHFLDEDTFKIYQAGDWEWADDDGSVLKWVQDKDAWQAVIRKYWELGCKRRNANAVLEDITEG